MNFSNIKKIYCLGIGGIGVSAIAKWFTAQGKLVSGEDLVDSEITAELRKMGIKVVTGVQGWSLRGSVSDRSNLVEQAGLLRFARNDGELPTISDLLIYSPAVPANNPVRIRARETGVRELSYPEVLGEISRERDTIAISGTNGKSTTTALVGLMLEASGLDPLVIVGSKVKSFEHGNLRFGNGQKFVVEACEHQANMLKIQPQTAILTNIEEDHLDYYRDLEHIKDSFKKFVQSLPPDGELIFNADDAASLEVSKVAVNKISYGISNEANYRASNITTIAGRQEFILEMPGRREKIVLQIPGRFNVYNALAAIAGALENGASLAACQKVLADFPGLWRRFEKVGEYRGTLIISDYGHHPTAIKDTIAGAREFYPGRRLVLVYQPHQHNRTKKLFNDFVEALRAPDVLILSDIYDVAGREEAQDQNVSSEKLVQEINKENAFYGGDLENTLVMVKNIIKEGEVVIIMGAGSIDWVARHLITYNS